MSSVATPDRPATQTPGKTARCRVYGKADVAEILGVSMRTIYRMYLTGEMPRPMRVSGSVRWLRPTIDAWIEAGCPRCPRPSR